ncbi:hypothetical protein MRX96_042876 [Rhipicephalus microplus]
MIDSPFSLLACTDLIRSFFWSVPCHQLASPLARTPLAHSPMTRATNARLRAHAGGIGTRSICTFSLELDVDPLRMPPEIPIIRCNCPARLCSPTGDFRCMEVWEKIMVSYPRWIDRTRWSVRNETVDVTTGCVCATSRSAPAHNGGLDRTPMIDKTSTP